MSFPVADCCCCCKQYVHHRDTANRSPSTGPGVDRHDTMAPRAKKKQKAKYKVGRTAATNGEQKRLGRERDKKERDATPTLESVVSSIGQRKSSKREREICEREGLCNRSVSKSVDGDRPVGVAYGQMICLISQIVA